MRVLVTGAYGLIGSACLARLSRDGHELIAAGRTINEARLRAPYARWIEADFNRLTRSEDWAPLLQNVEAVVNCVGVLQDGARDDVRRVQVVATVALFAACERTGIRRVVHISAVGVEHTGPTDFARTKAKADDDLAHRDLDWVILRPGLVLAPAAYGGTAMLRGIAGFPCMTPLVGADAKIQVVAVDDLAEAVARSVGAGTPGKVKWDVAHPQILTLGEIVAGLRSWLGFPAGPLLCVPNTTGSMIAALADVIGFLGWRSPARSTAMAQLSAGVVGDPSKWLAEGGVKPKSFDEILAAQPSSVQERWFSRLYLLKPLAIASLSLFWIYTGVIALGPGKESAEMQLAGSGFPAAAVAMTVLWGAIFDIVIGLVVLVRRFTRTILILMLIATPLYLLTGTVLAPQLWLDPLGPLSKIAPMLVATSLTLAIVDER